MIPIKVTAEREIKMQNHKQLRIVTIVYEGIIMSNLHNNVSPVIPLFPRKSVVNEVSHSCDESIICN